MNRLILLVGVILLSLGLMMGFYQLQTFGNQDGLNKNLERIREGEEYLKHTNIQSVQKAIEIFSELSAKNLDGENYFRTHYGLARALEKNGELLVSLKEYQNLKKEKLSVLEKNQLYYSLGNLLLQVNNLEEGKSYLEEVLRNSSDSSLKSLVFLSFADFYFKKGSFEDAKKNYILALYEDKNNVKARIGWGKSLKKLGKEWFAYEIFDDYIDSSGYLDPDKNKVEGEFKNSVFEKGMSYFRESKYSQSIASLEKAISLGIGPNLEEKALYHIAVSYDALNNFQLALQYYNKVLNNSVYSLDQYSLYKKGTIYFKKEDYKKAAALFQQTADSASNSELKEKALTWKEESLSQLKDRNVIENGSENEEEEENSNTTTSSPQTTQPGQNSNTAQSTNSSTTSSTNNNAAASSKTESKTKSKK